MVLEIIYRGSLRILKVLTSHGHSSSTRGPFVKPPGDNQNLSHRLPAAQSPRSAAREERDGGWRTYPEEILASPRREASTSALQSIHGARDTQHTWQASEARMEMLSCRNLLDISPPWRQGIAFVKVNECLGKKAEYIFRGYLCILSIKTKGKRILLCELEGMWCFSASCQRKLYYPKRL